MRTGIIIITGIILAVGVAVFFRTSNSDFLNADKKKEKKKDKNDDANGDEQLSTVTILNKTEVPDILKELSALCYVDADRFATVQDEKGSIFIYNTSSKKIEKEIPFAGKGDYEGVAIVKQNAYVLRSDGQIFEVKNYATKPVVKLHKTHLTSKHDTEGFCYDSKSNRLLVAIKGSEAETKQYKGIYAFNLSNKSMEAAPIYKIDLSHEVFASGKKNNNINPSGIAIHPLNGDIYITEGTRPKLLILDQGGKIKSLTNLNTSDFSQPEGITFSPEGRIFISNEGVKAPGNILEIESI